MSKATGATVPLATLQSCPLDLTVDDSRVYWVNGRGFSAGTVLTTFVLGGPIGSVHADQDTRAIYATGDAVYVVASPPGQEKTLTRISNLTPFMGTTIDDEVGYGFAWDEDHVYYFPAVRDQRPRYDLVKRSRAAMPER